MKKILIPVIVVAALILIGMGICFFTGGIQYDKKSFEKIISDKLHDRSDIEIVNQKDIQNVKVVAFTQGNYIGRATFTANIFGHYQLFGLGIGTGRSYRCNVDNIYGKNYFIFVGKNDGNLAKASILLSGLNKDDQFSESKKEVKIPNEKYFIIAENLKSDFNYNNNFTEAVTFYDKNGNPVTPPSVE